MWIAKGRREDNGAWQWGVLFPVGIRGIAVSEKYRGIKSDGVI